MYGIIYLPTARKQLENIVDYLASELNAPDAVLDFIDEVKAAAKSLAEMPYRHPIYHTSFAVLEEVRWISVKNYNMFYKVFEEKNHGNPPRTASASELGKQIASIQRIASGRLVGTIAVINGDNDLITNY